VSERDDSRLVEYLYGELPEDEVRAIERDPESLEDARELAALLSVVREGDPGLDPPAFLDAKIMAEARQVAEAAPKSAWRRWLTTPVLGGLLAATAASLFVVVNIAVLDRPADEALAPTPASAPAQVQASIAPGAVAEPMAEAADQADQAAPVEAAKLEEERVGAAADRSARAEMKSGLDALEDARKQQDLRPRREAAAKRNTDKDSAFGGDGLGSAPRGDVASGRAAGAKAGKMERQTAASGAETEKSREDSAAGEKSKKATSGDDDRLVGGLAQARREEASDESVAAPAKEASPPKKPAPDPNPAEPPAEAAPPRPAVRAPALAAPPPPPAGPVAGPATPAPPVTSLARLSDAEQPAKNETLSKTAEAKKGGAADVRRVAEAEVEIARAQALISAARLDEAEQALVRARAALSNTPGGARIALRLGQLLLSRKKSEAALNAARQAASWTDEPTIRQQADALAARAKP